MILGNFWDSSLLVTLSMLNMASTLHSYTDTNQDTRLSAYKGGYNKGWLYYLKVAVTGSINVA